MFSHKAWVLALGLSVLGLGPAGCRRGPGQNALTKDVQGRLDKTFGKGLFKLRGMKRKGHYPLNDEGGLKRTLLYFNAELVLLRDRKLAAWDQTNVGSLISVLGATATSVRGVKTGGNRKGDVIEVRGAAAFAHKSDRWISSPFVAGKNGKKARPKVSQLAYRRDAKKVLELGALLSKGRHQAELAALSTDLEGVLERTERRLARAKGVLSIATGGPGGEYHRQGHRLAEVLRKGKIKAQAFSSAGSLENCEWVQKREVVVAYTQGDIAAMAHKGIGVWQGRVPLRDLRALCSLYPEAVQIVVRADRGLDRVDQLAGKRVEVGAMGSGLRHNAMQILGAVGLKLGSFRAVEAHSIDLALSRLRSGDVDAVFVTSAFPNPAIEKMAARMPLKLLGLSKETVAKLMAGGSLLMPMTVPAKTYAGIAEARKTVGVTAMLVARRDTPAATVRALLSGLFSNVQKLSAGSSAAYYISKKTALRGITLPLHPTAKAFLSGTTAIP